MTPEDRIQHLISGIGGLQRALGIALETIANDHGQDARQLLEALRDRAISDMKNSDIPAEFEMKHASLVRPSIEAIEMAFDEAIAKLDGQ
ncbi:hypothetical protein QMZ05_17895 [Bradyrhizobium sp. INPA03-11B]|uniref:hypothetical protein n=1 Tax=Bradyrhizobium sp. INPA03-11B TaxID=418598 RepID=UPI00338DC057